MMETYHSNVIRCFIWDLQETSWGRSNGTSWIRTTETSSWRTTKTSLGVSLETCLRRSGYVLMRRRCYVFLRRRHEVPIRRRGDVPMRRLGDAVGCFIWDVAATSLGCTERRHYDVATTFYCRVGSLFLKLSCAFSLNSAEIIFTLSCLIILDMTFMQQ